MSTNYLVRSLILSLLHYSLMIYINNFFTLVPLFIELRLLKYGIINTMRLYKEFLNVLSRLKTENILLKLEWNSLFT